MLRAGRHPWTPGQRAAYSNLPFVLIGLALENITGITYSEVVRGSISQPLGLRATGFDVPRLDTAVIPVGNASSSISTSIGVYNASVSSSSTTPPLFSVPRNELNKLIDTNDLAAPPVSSRHQMTSPASRRASSPTPSSRRPKPTSGSSPSPSRPLQPMQSALRGRSTFPQI
jgi:CubicO group peptidase (beta-lactamase class C family)